MQFESLKVYCDVVRHRSFSHAAAVNDMTQSAASQIVSHLEKRLGVRLIDRSTRPLQPTIAGKLYFEGCKQLVDQYFELEASVREAHLQVVSSIQVAAIYSVGVREMTRYIDQFEPLCPHTKVHVDYLHPDKVYERVLDGVADIGLLSFPKKMRELESTPWREEQMVLICSINHPLAANDSISANQLDDLEYVGFDRNLVIRRQVDRFWKEHGVTPRVELEFDNIENIKKAVEVGAGVALLPKPSLVPELQAGTLKALTITDASMVRPLAIIHRKHPKLRANTQLFINLLMNQAADDSSSPKSVDSLPNTAAHIAQSKGARAHGSAS